MRIDSPAFAAKNLARSKEPHYAIEVAFDSANTILRWFTTHADTALPAGATAIKGVVKGLSGTSQTLNPDTATATIGAISFELVDLAGIVTSTLGGQIALGRSTRRQRVQAYVGYPGLAWADYTLLQTQLMTGIDIVGGAYRFRCMDVQREMRKDLFDVAKTTLAASLGLADTTVNVYDTSAFEMVAHGTSYSDAPSATVGYVKIEQEVIRYTGKTATTFTGCTRGALNTRAAEHVVDAAADPDRRTAVEEYVYLEMPAVKLAYALMTGILYGQGGATLPASWHCGMSTDYVRLADFTSKPDLWDTADDEKGFPLRFEALTKTDGKKFIEQEIALPCGSFMPVYADGALGWKRMANILSGAAYVAMLDETNIVSYDDELNEDMEAVHNVLAIDWSYEPATKSYARKIGLIDLDSRAIYSKADPVNLKFRGLHGSRHSETVIRQLFDRFRDRYTGPPYRYSPTVLHALNGLEAGDVVRVKLDDVRDYHAASGTLDRAFEIQGIAIDWFTGRVTPKLFASSRAPGAVAATGDTSVLSAGWWIGTGTALSSVLTITGSNPGHVTAGGTLTGNADLTAAGAIYYYDGDLVIDAGVTVTLAQNVQLRIHGQLTNNGTISGVGGGLAGAAGQAVLGAESPGTPGFIGVTEAGGGIDTSGLFGRIVSSLRGVTTVGANAVVPSLLLSWDGADLTGIPSDLRGTSGGGGHYTYVAGYGVGAAGGAGGAGGAGLCLICKGFSQGAAGKINLSGAAGSLGGSVTPDSVTFHAGAGAGGAPGALLILLDGALVTATDLDEDAVIALQGTTPQPPGRVTEPVVHVASLGVAASSYYVGTGDGSLFPVPSLSGARGGSRVQYVPGDPGAVADASVYELPMVSSLGLASGTAELLTQSDGTVVPRIKLTWPAVPDSRVKGYEPQFKKSADSIWQDAPLVLGQSATQTHIAGVKDGVAYDVQIRAAGDVRLVSPWTTVTNYTVIGKTEKPSNVGGLSFTDPILSWPKVTDPDLLGYVVRYQADGVSTDWDSATPAHVDGHITEARFDTSLLVGATPKMLVKAKDTTGGLSTAVSGLTIDLRPPQVASFLVSRQPDGTREFTWTMSSSPSDLEGWKIRYYLGSTSDWSAMTALHNGVLKASPFESNQLAAGTWTFAIKAVDWAGNESATATFLTVTIGDPRIAGAIVDIKEEPGWTGTKTSCHVDSGTGWLVADDTSPWSAAVATWSGRAIWNKTPVSPIIYQLNIDIGTIAPFVPLVTATGDGSQTIEEQHSDDDISYSAWAAVGPQITARYIRIRITVAGSYPKIKTMRSILSGNPISEVIEDLDTSTLTGAYRIGVGDIRLPIQKSYAIIQKVDDITFQNVGPGYTWDLIDKDASVGPRVKLYNGSGSLADATIDAGVRGLPT